MTSQNNHNCIIPSEFYDSMPFSNMTINEKCLFHHHHHHHPQDSSYAGDSISNTSFGLSLFVTCLLMILMFMTYWQIKPHYVPIVVPGPKRYPFIGILKYIIDNFETGPSSFYLMSQKHKTQTWGGPVPNMGGLPGAYFFIHDERNLKHILCDNFDNYEKGRVYRRSFRELLGNGIFASDGLKWRVHRKITSNMFSRNLLRHTAAATNRKLDDVIEFLDEKLVQREQQQQKHDEEGAVVDIDIQDLFYRLTFDIISMVAFGVEYDSVRQERQHEFALAFDEMQALITKRFCDPIFEITKLLRLTKRERRIRELRGILDKHAMDIINSKRRTVADEGSKLGPDLISRFLEYSENHDETITNNELRDIVMNMLLAGRDTTAAALSWTFYELTKHPHVIESITQDVRTTLCDNNDGGDAPRIISTDYDSISRLKYTHAVAMEALRLHPSVPNDIKYAIKPDVLPDGTAIPKGAAVLYLPYSMGRNQNLWGEDAHMFRPERFLNKKEPSSYKFAAFNAGPRLCLGKPLALMTMKIVMARLLTRYKIVDERGHEGEDKWGTVRSMKGGFVVRLSRREETEKFD